MICLLDQDYGIVPNGFWRDASWTLVRGTQDVYFVWRERMYRKERLLWHQLEERVSEVKKRVWTEKAGARLDPAEGRDITHVVDGIFESESALYTDESPEIAERNPAITFMRPKSVQLEVRKLSERPEKLTWALEWSYDRRKVVSPLHDQSHIHLYYL